MEKCSQSGNSRFIDFWLNQFFLFLFIDLFSLFFLCLSGISRALLEVCVCVKNVPKGCHHPIMIAERSGK